MTEDALTTSARRARRSKVDFAALKSRTRLALNEFDYVVAVYETWKVAAHDDALHDRMGNSFATNTLNILLPSLWRDALLSLSRIWDKSGPAVNISSLLPILRRGDFVTALVDHCHPDLDSFLRAHCLCQWKDTAAKAVRLLARYERDGDRFHLLDDLRTIRHERLAHRAFSPSRPDLPAFDAEKFEIAYKETAELISLLMSLLNQTVVDPLEVASQRAQCAEFFWAPVCGERNEQHPVQIARSQDGHGA